MRAGEDAVLRRRHRDWYQQLVARARAEWISDRQAYWLARLASRTPEPARGGGVLPDRTR